MAVDADGNFVVTYTRDQTATNKNVYARLFQDSRAFVRQFSVATRPAARRTPASPATPPGPSPSPTRRPDGVVLRRYDADGTMLGVHEIDVPADFQATTAPG